MNIRFDHAAGERHQTRANRKCRSSDRTNNNNNNNNNATEPKDDPLPQIEAQGQQHAPANRYQMAPHRFAGRRISTDLSAKPPTFKVGKFPLEAEMMRRAFGCVHSDFLEATLIQWINACPRHGGINIDSAVNCMRAIVEGIGPRDQIEVTLAAQMAVLHVLNLYMARNVAHTKDLEEFEIASRRMESMMLTYGKLAETLARYRTKGSQTVTVQYVNVANGGQAVVGTVNTKTKTRVKSRKTSVKTSVKNSVKTSGKATSGHATPPTALDQHPEHPSGPLVPLAAPGDAPLSGDLLPPGHEQIVTPKSA
ncbi:hypothetical protein [Rhodoplanes sp. SY1]|uniref:hypothetical protein n=1 Tax=Rhodoplanes sp. SY1 TaxID=3166646 RepID=UPI0038B65265